jgi:hypothetical protein
MNVFKRAVYSALAIVLAAVWLGAYLAYTTYKEMGEADDMQPLLGVVRGQSSFPRVLR